MPMNRIFLAIDLRSPEPLLIRKQQWEPPWEQRPVYVSDGHRCWDCREPAQEASLRATLEAASQVVVEVLPLAWSTWNVPWWIVTVCDRIQRLGYGREDLTLSDLCHRLQVRLEGPLLDLSQGTACRLPKEEAISFCHRHSRALRQVWDAQINQTNPALVQHLCTIEMPAARIHAQMTVDGLLVHRERASQLAEAIPRLLTQYEAGMQRHGLKNPWAYQHVERWHRDHGFDPDDDIDDLKDAHPCLALLARWNRIRGMREQRWLNGGMNGPDGRLHPYHQMLHAETGRSCTLMPEIPNLPKGLRPIICAPPGYGLVELDYVGQELLVAAYLSGDHQLLKAYRCGDLVSYLARFIFPRELGHFTDDQLPALKEAHPELRERAKPVIYGTLYGQTPYGLSQAMGIDEDKANRMQQGLFNHCPRLAAWMKRNAALAQREHKIHISPLISRRLGRQDFARGSNRIASLARNTPIQGTASIMFRTSLTLVAPAIAPLGGRIVLPIHDASLLEGPLDRLAQITAAAQAAMIEAGHLCLGPQAEAIVSPTNKDVSCWNKDGKTSMFEEFLQ